MRTASGCKDTYRRVPDGFFKVKRDRLALKTARMLTQVKLLLHTAPNSM